MNVVNDKSELKYETFRQETFLSMEEICREIYFENRDAIKIKKEATAVKNLVTIFHATLKLANQKGFQTTSLRDLSRASGLSMGALYSYFSSKDELLSMIQDQGMRLALRVLSKYIDPAAAPVSRLKNAIRAHLYLTEVLQPWFYFSYMEAKNLDKEQRRRAIESELATERIFIRIIEDGNDAGDFQVESPQLMASAIKAMLQDWYLKRWKYQRRNISVDEYADFLEKTVLTLCFERSRGKG